MAYDKQYVDGLRKTRDSYAVFTILLLVGCLFLLIMFIRGQDKIVKLQHRIGVLESAFAQDNEALVPDGRGGTKKFDIIKRF